MQVSAGFFTLRGKLFCINVKKQNGRGSFLRNKKHFVLKIALATVFGAGKTDKNRRIA